MAGLTTLAVGAYSANKQAKSAKSAANKQAKGVENAQAIQQQATQQALPLIQQGFGQARDAITSGANQAQQNLLGGQQQQFDTLNAGYDQVGQTLESAYNKASGVFEPVASQGAGASQMQAALSGALGSAAQQQAFNNYNDSPGQKYLQAQQEQAILRNESALGGGVSSNGRVLSALQEQAAGNAAQNYNNNFSQLGQIASRGDSANQNIAQLQQGLGQSKSAIQQQLANLLSGLQGNTASNLANLNTSTAGQLAQSFQGQGTTQANTLLGAGSEQAQLAQNLGQVKSGSDIYNSQNASPLLQGLQAGIGAYGAGAQFGNFGGAANLLSGFAPKQAGTSAGDYTGNAYKQWAAGQ